MVWELKGRKSIKNVDFMLQLDCDTREQYFRDSLHFFQRRYGKENVMYCQCHMDESNPHIHIGVVPITHDGRLSAKVLFCPKTLEQLQTDFHREVSQHYGLERGEHHAKKYLPLQQFKAQQAKIKAQLFVDDLHLADISHQKIKEAEQAAHFPTKGFIFTSEDKDNIELPIKHYLYLKQSSIESSKMKATIHILQDDNQQWEFFRDIEQTAKYSLRKTGFENIDEAQIFMPGLYMLGALPASGKTTFAWQLLNQLAEKGEPCIYCSFEMSRAELFTKSIVRELYRKNPQMSERLNLTSANIRRGAMRGSRELREQAFEFSKSAMNLRVAELSNTSVTELIEGLKPFVADEDRSLVICVDYLQIIPSKNSKVGSVKEKIDEVMLRLKDF